MSINSFPMNFKTFYFTKKKKNKRNIQVRVRIYVFKKFVESSKSIDDNVLVFIIKSTSVCVCVVF